MSCVCGDIGTETFEDGELKEHVHDRKVVDDKYLKELFSLSEVVILGNHGPVHKEPLDISYIAADFIVVGESQNVSLENIRGKILHVDEYAGCIHIGFRK